MLGQGLLWLAMLRYAAIDWRKKVIFVQKKLSRIMVAVLFCIYCIRLKSLACFISSKALLVLIVLAVIWVVRYRYKDDRHKYPMNNNRDHLVGRLTTMSLKLSVFSGICGCKSKRAKTYCDTSSNAFSATLETLLD